MTAVAFVQRRTTSGQMDVSTTLRLSTPRTRQNWSATAVSSESGPILQELDKWMAVPRCLLIYLSTPRPTPGLRCWGLVSRADFLEGLAVEQRG